MATYYARNVTDNWASNTSWDTVSSGGAGPAGPPIAGDTAIFDSGFTGNITIAANAACTTLTVQAGATGTLTWGAFVLTVAGSITFVSGFNLAGSTAGRLFISATSTITSGGLTIPCNVTLSAAATYTLVGNLVIAKQLLVSNGITMSGAYDISCETFHASSTPKFVAGQKLIISTGMVLGLGLGSSGFSLSGLRISSATASSTTYIQYNGTAAECKVFLANFTDVDFSTYSTPVTNLDNWYGVTLTRTTGITNRTSADIGGGGGMIVHPGMSGGMRG